MIAKDTEFKVANLNEIQVFQLLWNNLG
jgi:hypothetical protein